MMESTVELSQKEKLKKFNEKLLMMKNKNIDKNKLINAVPTTKKEQPTQQSKPQSTQKPQQQKIQKPNTQPKNETEQPKSQGQQGPQNGDTKTKGIKKDKKQKKQSTVTLRKVAGLVWKDNTLEEWPQNDYRIFVGNLGNEVTDQILSSVFRNKYNSFQMAKVVQDKRIGKTKGYGFVSLKDPKDFLNALKQMNNKYIGNRPVKVTKSSWKDRSLDSEKNKVLPSDFQANKGKETNKICTNFKYVSPY